jgi:hypothetical protein
MDIEIPWQINTKHLFPRQEHLHHIFFQIPAHEPLCHLFLLFPDQELEGKDDIYVPDQEDFLEINQSETRIACGSHVC